MRGNKPSMLENQKFGRLAVLRRSTKADRSGSVFWICKCDCGNEVTVRSDLLKRLHTQSCGCLKKEAVSAALKLAKTTHGFTHTSEYRIWKGIKSRCCDPNSQAYRLYRGWTLKEALRCIENEVFEYNEDKLTLESWCDLLSLDKDTTYLRVVRGISLQRIVEE